MSRVRDLWGQRPYVFLLLALLLNLLLQPLVFFHFGRVGWFTLATFMLVLLAATHATQATRRVRLVLLGSAWMALVFGWVGLGLRALDHPDWMLSTALSLRHGFSAAFFGIVTMLLIGRTLAPGRITTSRIFAAICAYLLLGILWAEWYALLTVWYGQVLSIPVDAPLSEITYFSFVTLTTLGYGDILPEHPLARVLAYLEAVTGVLYLATLVARLVALQIAHGVQAGYLEHDDESDDS